MKKTKQFHPKVGFCEEHSQHSDLLSLKGKTDAQQQSISKYIWGHSSGYKKIHLERILKAVKTKNKDTVQVKQRILVKDFNVL